MKRIFNSKQKEIVLKLPEYYLILLVGLAAYTPPFSFNPLLLVFILLLLGQIYFQSKALGLILSILFTLVNIYMIGALLSELHEFPVFNAKAQQLLFVGMAIWLINISACVLMFFKFLRALFNGAT